MRLTPEREAEIREAITCHVQSELDACVHLGKVRVFAAELVVELEDTRAALAVAGEAVAAKLSGAVVTSLDTDAVLLAQLRLHPRFGDLLWLLSGQKPESDLAEAFELLLKLLRGGG